MAGRIAIMNRGKFVQIGEPEEIYEHPTTRYSAEFIGSVNVFEGLLKERGDDGLVIESPGLVHPLKVDSDNSVVDNVPVYVALRPEKSCFAMSRPPMAITLPWAKWYTLPISAICRFTMSA